MPDTSPASLPSATSAWRSSSHAHTTSPSAISRREVSGKDKAFYEGKVAAAQFFAQTNLPRISAERAIAERTDLDLMDLDEAAF